MSAIALLYASAPGWAVAEASLGYSPQRVIIGPRERSATLTLTNRGDAAATFRIAMRDVIYKNDGSVALLENTPDNFPSAKPHIRFSPKQVRLDPGHSQRIRILVRSAKLPAGEYRVHAQMTTLPDRELQAPHADDGVVRGSVGINQAVAIPVILRRGRTQATGSIQKAAFSDDRKSIDLLLGRKGDQSLYLDIRLFKGREIAGDPIDFVRGVAVPVPNATRRFRFGLTEPAARGAHLVEIVDSASGKRIHTLAIQ